MKNYSNQQAAQLSPYVIYGQQYQAQPLGNSLLYFPQPMNYNLNFAYSSSPNLTYCCFPEQPLTQLPYFSLQQSTSELNLPLENQEKPSRRQAIEFSPAQNIKIEHVEQEKSMIIVPKKQSETSLSGPQKIKHFPRKTGSKKRERVQIRTERLERVFKNLLASLLGQYPDYEVCKEAFLSSLQGIQELSSRKQFSEDIFETLKTKFQRFRKTKEELVKYIIRRTYHNAKIQKGSSQNVEFQRLQAFHERNLKVHKSMNHEFLKKEFANPIFLQYYQNFLDQLDDQFETENLQRVERLANSLTTSWIQQNLEAIQVQKKLPWTHIYKLKIKILAKGLMMSHRNSKSAQRSEHNNE